MKKCLPLLFLLLFSTQLYAEGEGSVVQINPNLSSEQVVALTYQFENICGPFPISECRHFNPFPCNAHFINMQTCVNYEAYCGPFQTPSQCRRNVAPPSRTYTPPTPVRIPVETHRPDDSQMIQNKMFEEEASPKNLSNEVMYQTDESSYETTQPQTNEISYETNDTSYSTEEENNKMNEATYQKDETSYETEDKANEMYYEWNGSFYELKK